MNHTKSLWQRLVALLIDLTVLNLLLSLAVYPWANSLSSPLGVSSGIFHSTNCYRGEIFAVDGRPIDLRSEDKLVICDTLSVGLFPSRVAVVQRKGSAGSTFSSTQTYFPLDENNRIRAVIDSGWIFSFLIVLIVVLFEVSPLAATPGKMVFGLRVRSTSGNRPNIVQAAARNLIKYAYVLGLLIIAATQVKFMFMSAEETQAMFFDNQLGLKPFQEIWNGAGTGGGTTMLAISIAIGLLNIAIWLSIFFPWSNRGRGLYDKWAGTMVVRQAAETVLPTPSAPA